jgi:DNA-binding transcriptional LysR family regulator
LAKHGTPLHPQDLAHHACLTLSHIPNSRFWSFNIGEEAVEVEVHGPVVADSAHMLLKLAVSGAGIIRFGDIIVAEAVRSGRLVPLVENFQQSESFPLWVIFQRRRQRAPRVKAFLDFLTERFGSAPWRSAQLK